ncbi:zinc finger CCCH domain-containing protein 11A-like [Tympanuchus pallidicinctus]|uniref:zinc finger CCCH domain-containing protein 11A-like n=1 Tax=Tympanuchus pallidicinctus TaxID=109042 RepID=UPI0022873280|nr:zinc finger CCCH domain-containing protein 11A-like [Tympanuchus pallidicinctus]
MECGTAPKRVRGAESNGERRMNAVQEVYSERAHLRTESKAHVRAGGLLSRAGLSEGRRPSPAVSLHSLSKTLPERKRKDLEGAKQATEQLPPYKRVRSECSREKALRMYQSGDSVLPPAVQPGPAAAQSSRRRARRKRRTGQKKRRAEMMKASLRAAAAHAESSTVNSLVEMMQKLQLKD